MNDQLSHLSRTCLSVAGMYFCCGLCSCNDLNSDKACKLRENDYNVGPSSLPSHMLHCVPGVSGMGAPTREEIDLIMIQRQKSREMMKHQ